MKEQIKAFYESNSDFKAFVDKGCISYKRSLEKELSDPITKEYYKSMGKGGCNEVKHHNPVL